MQLTTKLLGFLNRVFDKDPKKFLALRINYAGGLTWSIADDVLTTRVTGGPGADLSINLADHTLGSLAAFLAGRTGYSVQNLDASRQNLSARVLLDASGDPATSNGDHLYGYTSLLWAYMEVWAAELKAAADAIVQMLRQMEIPTAEGAWLDELGAMYGIPRMAGEVDAQYGPRIIAEVLRPKSNNVAIELAIQAYTGQLCQVVDVSVDGSIEPLHDGSITHDNTEVYDTGFRPRYGLFDVTYGYDLLNGGEFDDFQEVVRAVVNRLRAAGTYLRALALQTPGLTDVFTPPVDGALLVTAQPILTDTFDAPTESTTLTAMLGALVDAFTAPTDEADDLVITSTTSYSGLRRHNGHVLHYGGCEIDSNLAGDIEAITPL